jgi:Na+/H+ antiporter NhaA
LLTQAKVGILAASLVSGLAGYFTLLGLRDSSQDRDSSSEALSD